MWKTTKEIMEMFGFSSKTSAYKKAAKEGWKEEMRPMEQGGVCKMFFVNDRHQKPIDTITTDSHQTGLKKLEEKTEKFDSNHDSNQISIDTDRHQQKTVRHQAIDTDRHQSNAVLMQNDANIEFDRHQTDRHHYDIDKIDSHQSELIKNKEVNKISRTVSQCTTTNTTTKSNSIDTELNDINMGRQVEWQKLIFC